MGTMTKAKPLEVLVQELPPDMRDEVRDFVEFLLAKRGRNGVPPRKWTQDYARSRLWYNQ